MNEHTHPCEGKEDDAALIRRYLTDGHSEAVGELFRRHANLAYSVALRVMRNPSDAEDAVQSAFVQVLRKARLFQGDAAGVKSWLMAIVVNACRQNIRKNVRRTRREEKFFADIPETTQADGANADERDELLALVKKTLDRLPGKCRVALWLHYYEGLPFREVAGILSVRESTVRSHSSRGIEALRRLLRQSGVTVSGSSLAGLIAALPPESPRDAFWAGLRKTLERIHPDKLIAYRKPYRSWNLRGTSSPFWKSMAAMSVVTIAVAVPLVLRFRAGPISREEIAVTNTETNYSDNVVFLWNFEEPELPETLKVVYGGSRHVRNGGIDGSGCLETITPMFLMGVDVPEERLPVKVVCRFQAISRSGYRAPHYFTVSWSHFSQAISISGLGDVQAYPGASKSPWFSITAYVTDSWVDVWMNGRRQNLFMISRTPQSRLLITTEGTHYIDNLAVYAIRSDALPDIGLYVEAIENIPEEKRTGFIPLPHLKPGNPKKQVIAEFQEGIVSVP